MYTRSGLSLSSMISSIGDPSWRFRYTSGSTPRSVEVRPVESLPSISGIPITFASVGAMSTCAHSVSLTPDALIPGPLKTSGARACTTSAAPCCPACRPNCHVFGLTTMSGAFGLSNSCAIFS